MENGQGTIEATDMETTGAFSGDHLSRTAYFFDGLRKRMESIGGPLTVESAEDMMMYAECIAATLRSFLIFDGVWGRAKTGGIHPVKENEGC
jgi:hypothetical protein